MSKSQTKSQPKTKIVLSDEESDNKKNRRTRARAEPSKKRTLKKNLLIIYLDLGNLKTCLQVK